MYYMYIYIYAHVVQLQYPSSQGVIRPLKIQRVVDKQLIHSVMFVKPVPSCKNMVVL